MSEKYYIEQGTEQHHFFIESEWHVICKVNTQLECICLGKSEAELICRLLNEEEKRKSLPKNINIKQINIVPVQNTCTTQCYAYMYALDNEGILWFKRDNDTKWTKESLECE